MTLASVTKSTHSLLSFVSLTPGKVAATLRAFREQDFRVKQLA